VSVVLLLNHTMTGLSHIPSTSFFQLHELGQLQYRCSLMKGNFSAMSRCPNCDEEYPECPECGDDCESCRQAHEEGQCKEE
jgi:hypothetical protein